MGITKRAHYKVRKRYLTVTGKRGFIFSLMLGLSNTRPAESWSYKMEIIYSDAIMKDLWVCLPAGLKLCGTPHRLFKANKVVLSQHYLTKQWRPFCDVRSVLLSQSFSAPEMFGGSSLAFTKLWGVCCAHYPAAAWISLHRDENQRLSVSLKNRLLLLLASVHMLSRGAANHPKS